jgi:hypothetical protein
MARTEPPFVPGLSIHVETVPTVDRDALLDPGWTRTLHYLADRDWTSLTLPESEAPEPALAASVSEDAINAFETKTGFGLERVGLQPEFGALGARSPLVFVTAAVVERLLEAQRDASDRHGLLLRPPAGPPLRYDYPRASPPAFPWYEGAPVASPAQLHRR